VDSLLDKDLAKFIITSSESIRHAMECINNNWREVSLVSDNEQRIIGVITDGDIRRGLLHGLTMDSPATEVMAKTFFSVGPDADRTTILDMMKSRSIRQVPVLDAQGKLIGIHFLEELIGTSVKPNVAVIMAGGKGIRLRPLTENCPKPMIPVAGRPILERVILHLVGFGIREIYLSINYLGNMIEQHFGHGSAFGCSIRYLREEKPLGTGGPLSLLPEQPNHPLIVMNGDQVTQVDIAKLLEFHDLKQVDATIAIKPYQVEIPFGVIRKKGDRLIEILEKPTMNYVINTGIYVLSPNTLSLIPRDQEFPITALFDLMIARKMAIGVHFIEEEWTDVGRQEDLNRANGLL
jgi:dTDP-glucose pyrophosphorylase/predicted transcriptional regulator